jgi:hypothetical protein
LLPGKPLLAHLIRILFENRKILGSGTRLQLQVLRFLLLFVIEEKSSNVGLIERLHLVYAVARFSNRHGISIEAAWSLVEVTSLPQMEW